MDAILGSWAVQDDLMDIDHNESFFPSERYDIRSMSTWDTGLPVMQPEDDLALDIDCFNQPTAQVLNEWIGQPSNRISPVGPQHFSLYQPERFAISASPFTRSDTSSGSPTRDASMGLDLGNSSIQYRALEVTCDVVDDDPSTWVWDGVIR